MAESGQAREGQDPRPGLLGRVPAALRSLLPSERRRRAYRALVEELVPRSLMIVGGTREHEDLRGRRLTVFLHSSGEANDGRWVRRFDGPIGDFLEHRTLVRLMTPWWRGTGAFCDLLIFGDALPPADLDGLLPNLHFVLLSSTVIAFPSTLADAAVRLAATAERLSLRKARIGGVRLWLVSGSPSVPGEDLRTSFLRHRVSDPPPPPALTPVPDAPLHPSTTVQPVYREVGQAPKLMRRKAKGGKSVRRWWGRPLQLLPTSIGIGDATFQRANNVCFGVLVAPGGALHDASFVWRHGFGANAIAERRTPWPTYLREGSVRRPLTDAAAMPVLRTVDEPLLLLGYIEPRFGHLLTETLSRSWAVPWARERGYRVLVWTELAWTPLQEAALALLGLGPDRIEIAQPGTRYTRLLMPSDGFRLMGSISPVAALGWRLMAETAARLAPPGTTTAERVYLSRRAVDRRRLENEDELEDFLGSEGFACIAPETLDLAGQVRLVAGADQLIGCFGSQMHLSAFSRAGAERLVIGQEHFLGPEDILFSVANGSEVSFFVEPQAEVPREIAESAPWRIDMRRFRKGFARWRRDIAARR